MNNISWQNVKKLFPNSNKSSVDLFMGDVCTRISIEDIGSVVPASFMPLSKFSCL